MPVFFSYFRFENLFKAHLLLLPFTTILSVFTSQKLGIPGVGFYKEILLIFMAISMLFLHWKHRLSIEWTGFDLLIALYMGYLVILSVFTTGMSGIVYGGRYDFEFLIAFLIILHGARFLEQKLPYYIRLFLISGGIALIFSILIRFVLSEDSLLLLGFSGNPSNWQFGASVPIFHGVDGANIRRFQGILDGPNTMGAFLLIYLGTLLYYVRFRKDWYFFVGIITFGLIGLIVLTYSRSALLALMGSGFILLICSARYIYRKFPIQAGILGVLFVLLLGAFFIKYSTMTTAIISREGSTKGHMERMILGLERFGSAPFGQGLGSAGPGYRYVQDTRDLSKAEAESLDRYYIPESWYVQQLIEGGVFGAGVFAFLFLFLLLSLYRVHPIWFATFLSVCIMNLFLHTFESSTVSLLLFLLLGLVLGTHRFKDFLHPYGHKK